MTWMPIETAPRDGARILTGISSRLLGVTYYAPWAKGWVHSATNAKQKPQPTHWLPLPPLPEALP